MTVSKGAVPGGTPRPADLAQVATAVLDATGAVVGWTRAAQQLLGYPAAEVLDRSAAGLLAAPEDRPKAALVAERCRAQGGWSGLVDVRHRDGRQLEVLLRVSPMLGSADQALWAVSASHAGQTSGSEVGRLLCEPFLAYAPVGMAVLDTDLRYVWADAALKDRGAVPADRWLGRRVGEVFPDIDVEAVETLMRGVLDTGEPVLDYEIRLRPPADPTREHAYRVSYFRLADPAGRALGVGYMASDVTDRWRARERLLLLNEAGARIGSTLDIAATAQELADVAVPRFADFVGVDVLESVLHGGEVAPGALCDGPPLRRVGMRSVRQGCPEAIVRTGETVRHAPSSPAARTLLDGRATLIKIADSATEEWAAEDPERAAKVREFGFHSLIVAPLRARGVTLGLVHFLRWQRPDPFEADDVLLAEEVVARAAVCVDNARRFLRERTAALALQRALLPGELLGGPALAAAGRYFAADLQSGAGGDWFDVIPLSGARVALVVGDVVGHGIHAAAAMGRLRTAVHTLADLDLPPDELLAHLDDLVIKQQGADERADRDGMSMATAVTGATCLYAVYDPVTRRCTMARAGHLPPAVVGPHGSVAFPDLPTGPPLGVGALPFESAELELPEGSLLALYTDGLIRTREEDIDVGLARLRGALARCDGTPEETCDNVVKALLPGPPADDAALLVARTRALGADRVASWDLPADPAVVARARDLAGAQLAAWGLDDLLFTTELIVSELVTNAIRYGTEPIGLRLIHTDLLICEVFDGSSTSPHLRHARTTDEGGRGLFLVAQLTQRWGTRYTSTGKVIWCEQDTRSAATGPDLLP